MEAYQRHCLFPALAGVILQHACRCRHYSPHSRGCFSNFAAPVILNGTRGHKGVAVNLNGKHCYAHKIALPDDRLFFLSENKNDAARELPRGVVISDSLADATSAASVDSVASGLVFRKEKFEAEVSMRAKTNWTEIRDSARGKGNYYVLNLTSRAEVTGVMDTYRKRALKNGHRKSTVCLHDA